MYLIKVVLGPLQAKILKISVFRWRKKAAAGENFENICSEEIKIARRRRNFFEISNPPP